MQFVMKCIRNATREQNTLPPQRLFAINYFSYNMVSELTSCG